MKAPISAFVLIAVLLGLLTSASVAAEPTTAQVEQAIWKLEHAYWGYVQENDIPAYLRLWHKDVVAWPSANAAPARKDHITDWLTSKTSSGFKYQVEEFKPGAIQVTGSVVVVYYWISFKWVV